MGGDRPDLIAEKIASFPRWHYQMELGGHLTPIFDADHVNRHRQRELYFFDPLVAHYGGSLEGKRVLDLGCNAGFWSLKALEAGCDFVWGIDGREMHIEQAEFVLSVKGVDPARYRLTTANLFDVDSRRGATLRHRPLPRPPLPREQAG